MHELGIAMEIHRACRKRAGTDVLESVRVAVGELSSVEPDLLRHAWEAVVADTADAAASLEIDWCPAHQTCSACGTVKERGPGSWLRLCPGCGGLLQVRGGDELDLLQMTILRRDADVRSA